MITIYHNPRCSKSRQGVALLEASGKNFKKITYLKELLTKEELTIIIEKLGLEPMDLIRKNETVWKENYKSKSLSNEELIEIMIQNPKLIERPIVCNNEKAVIGRPTEKIHTIL